MKNTTVREDVREIKETLNTVVGAIDRLASQVFDLRTDVDEIKTTMMTKQDKSELLATMDAITGKHKKSEQEQTLMSYRLQEHDTQIKQLQLASA